MTSFEQSVELRRIDYQDGTSVAVGGSRPHSGLDWARRVLEDASPIMRWFLRFGWRVGLLIPLAAAHAPGFVLGWRVVGPLDPASTPRAVLASHSLLGLDTRLVIETDGDRLVFRTLVQFGNPAARMVWAAVVPLHRIVVRCLIRSAARRAGG